MESSSGGNFGNDELRQTLSSIVQSEDAEITPIIDLVGSDTSTYHVMTKMDPDPNKVSDDELDDLVEEQLLLSRIKEMEHTRNNLAISRSVVLLGNDFKESNDNASTNNDDTDSIFGFMSHKQNDEEIKIKDALTKITKALTINVVMQSELNKLEIYLMEKLKENHDEQLKVGQEIEQLVSANYKRATKQRSQVIFGMPYFKDSKHFTCPFNADYNKMKALGQVLTINLSYSRPWRLKHKRLLEKGVKHHLVLEKTSDLQAALAKLKIKLQEDINKKTYNKILEDITRINNKINAIKENSLKDLFSSCSPSVEFDWMNISTQFVQSHTPNECQRMWHLYVKPTINKSPWTLKEDSRLIELASKYNHENWSLIASKLKTDRSAYQCYLNFQSRLNKDIYKSGKWTDEENNLLLSLIDKCKIGTYIPWSKVAYFFQTRTITQMYHHWTSTLNPELKKGRFSKSEDRLIISFVTKFGEDFNKIAKFFRDRTCTQLRQRYVRSIANKYFNTGRFSLEEDELLLSLVAKYGEKNWSAVSKHFVTRTRTQIRHRFTTIKNITSKQPGIRIDQIPRGPQAKSQNRISKAVSKLAGLNQKMSKPNHPSNKSITDCLKDEEEIIAKFRKGRRKGKRSDIDKNLLHYFRESYTNEKIKLKTEYMKPDVDKAANAMLLFCRFLQTHINPNLLDQAKAKKLHPTLRVVLDKMKARYSIWGCECLETVLTEEPNNCVCQQQTNIDYFPVSHKTTIVGEDVFSLQLLPEYNKSQIEVKEKKCKCSKDRIKHFIPYYLPPNIISSIGFRSVLFLKDKISISLIYDKVRCGFFMNDDIELHRNGLRKFTGFFKNHSSDEEDEVDIDEANKPKDIKHKINVDMGLSLPSTSKTNMDNTHGSLPDHTLFNNTNNTFQTPRVGTEFTPLLSTTNRLTERDAINLWKERLMAILGWPIVLSNQPPESSKSCDDTENVEVVCDDESNKSSTQSTVPEIKKTFQTRKRKRIVSEDSKFRLLLQENEVLGAAPQIEKDKRKAFQLYEEALSDDCVSEEEISVVDLTKQESSKEPSDTINKNIYVDSRKIFLDNASSLNEKEDNQLNPGKHGESDAFSDELSINRSLVSRAYKPYFKKSKRD